jgi:hypothetical protein
VTVTLGSNTSTLAIAEIHFSDLVIEPGATVSAAGRLRSRAPSGPPAVTTVAALQVRGRTEVGR